MMLVLTRKVNEKIIINNEIEIELLGIRNKTSKELLNNLEIRIGITAPNNLSVHREEVQVKINKSREK